MTLPADRRYSRDHFWAQRDGDVVRIGMTEYVVEAMGELQSIRFPALGALVARDQSCGEIEANKSVSDIYAPVGGTVEMVNEAAGTEPTVVTADPYGDGWLLALRVDADTSDEFGDLLDISAYRTLMDSDQP